MATPPPVWVRRDDRASSRGFDLGYGTIISTGLVAEPREAALPGGDAHPGVIVPQLTRYAHVHGDARHGILREHVGPQAQRSLFAAAVQSACDKISQREMQPTVGQFVAKQRSPIMQGTADSPWYIIASQRASARQLAASRFAPHASPGGAGHQSLGDIPQPGLGAGLVGRTGGDVVSDAPVAVDSAAVGRGRGSDDGLERRVQPAKAAAATASHISDRMSVAAGMIGQLEYRPCGEPSTRLALVIIVVCLGQRRAPQC